MAPLKAELNFAELIARPARTCNKNFSYNQNKNWKNKGQLKGLKKASVLAKLKSKQARQERNAGEKLKMRMKKFREV